MEKPPTASAEWRLSEEGLAGSALLVSGVADLIEGALDEVFSLIAQAVVDRGHRLDRAGGGAAEAELAVFHLTLVEGEGTVAQHDETAVGELTGVVLMEVEDDLLVGELVVADFHGIFVG